MGHDLPPGLRLQLAERTPVSCGAERDCYSRGLSTPGITAPALATLVGVCGAAIGLWLTGLRRRARIVVPLSAGVLLGVALFGLLPEMVSEQGWPLSLILFASGYGLLLLINRFAYPVCPTCSHDHDHHSCEAELHGFAAPLVGAAALHSFLDGWSVATVQLASPLGLRIAVPLAVALHKLPEGIALGGIMRASLKRRGVALWLCILAEGTTLVGGALGLAMGPHLGTRWITYPLGITAGWILYLAYHAIHEEWRRRGAVPTFVSALTGMAGAAVLQRGAERLFH
jgi:zinc transporter ZupT